MRHLVLEGPDGGGKTRLAEALMARFPELLKGDKASTSLRGPVRNLAAWVRYQYELMDKAPQPFLYDRHPVISEPIYGPIARGQAQPGFTPSPWLTSARLNLQGRTYVIWCIPPLAQCQKAVAEDRDMPGVTENIDQLHAAYLHEMTKWNGPGIRYDLTSTGVFEVTDDGFFQGALNWVDEMSGIFQRQVFRA